jgi:hypothetical protein
MEIKVLGRRRNATSDSTDKLQFILYIQFSTLQTQSSTTSNDPYQMRRQIFSDSIQGFEAIPFSRHIDTFYIPLATILSLGLNITSQRSTTGNRWFCTLLCSANATKEGTNTYSSNRLSLFRRNSMLDFPLLLHMKRLPCMVPSE